MLDLLLFDRVFPNYRDYRVPMWSKWKEEEGATVIEIAIPGFKKEDFSLYVEDGDLFLSINKNGKDINYSILSNDSKCKFEEATAKYSAGVLKISIPKKKSKRIELKVS